MTNPILRVHPNPTGHDSVSEPECAPQNIQVNTMTGISGHFMGLWCGMPVVVSKDNMGSAFAGFEKDKIKPRAPSTVNGKHDSR